MSISFNNILSFQSAQEPVFYFIAACASALTSSIKEQLEKQRGQQNFSFNIILHASVELFAKRTQIPLPINDICLVLIFEPKQTLQTMKKEFKQKGVSLVEKI